MVFTLRWLGPSLAVAVVSGLSSGFFLWSLHRVTLFHATHPWLLAWLPLAGLGSGLAYHFLGGNSEAGNNLLLKEIRRDSGEAIPARMAPLVLAGTLVTHLFGGSAGREGTAIQMAGALSDLFSRPFRLKPHERSVLLRASIAGGFSAVFGTPLAGTLFALEVVVAGSFSLSTLLPCLLSAVLADQVVAWLPVHHTHYQAGAIPTGLAPLVSAAVLGIAAGLLARLFAGLAHAVSTAGRTWVSWPPLRPALGGLVVALLGAWFGPRWLGLGVPVIEESFSQASSFLDPLGKLLLTTLTVGSGFKGGEVTPLFFIGSTLGSASAELLHLPVGTAAAVGFVAVFAGATNTPLACTVMAMELFGAPVGSLAAIACLSAWLSSGPGGIYAAQKHAFGKGRLPERPLEEDFL
ncbi:MAG: chloride channel protein [Fibrobacteria bacterium]|nr:chloride channel protein [Fibrobacteria bacterium]